MQTAQVKSDLDSYKVGDNDQRPWGKYVVTAVGKDESGEEYCEKDITVNPDQILSLQSHNHRREIWTVIQGTLTVVVDDKRLTLKEGESVNIPLQAIHCMANLEQDPCVVHERQMGLCSEEDIIRYVDAYGRAGTLIDSRIQASVDLFNATLDEIKAKA
jgi:mannose-6-phosphate isomerase-like protein (cupin superfamily)